MPQESSSIFDHIVEAIKIIIALFFLYFVFNDLSSDQFFRNVFVDWRWGRFLIAAVAFWIAKNFFADPGLQEWSLWKCILLVFYSVSILVIVGWSGYGMHTEEADPLFGGGRTVVDFVPTEVERDLFASRLFIDLLLPALLGTYLARRRKNSVGV